MSGPSLPQAVSELVEAQNLYTSTRVHASATLSQAQARRETAMRRVAALGLSRRQIAELTDLSHTRVNQILSTGSKKLPADVHLAPSVLGPPSTVLSGIVRVMAEAGSRSWTGAQVEDELTARGWPSQDVESRLVKLTTDGVILSVDGGGFTIHAYGDGT